MSKTSISNLVSRLSLLIILSSFFFTPSRAANAPDPGLVSQGEVLFKENCKTCHAIDKVEVGPALKDVTKRRDAKWLSAWIRNSSAVIASGDKYANDLYNKFDKASMTSFPSFKDDEIKAVLAYIDSESGKTVKKDEGPTPPTGEPVQPKDDTTSTIILILVVVVLILVLTTLIVFLSLIKRFLKDKEAS